MASTRFFISVSLFAAAFVLGPALAVAQPQLRVNPGEQMSADLGSSSISSTGSNTFSMTLRMKNDNNNGSLPTSFRRWWGVEIYDLDPGAADTINVTVTNAGHTDEITPVWSLDGGPRERVPNSNRDYIGGSQHTFTLNVPSGVSSVKVWKYWPYTIQDYIDFTAPLRTHPRVTVTDIGDSVLGRDIEEFTITDPGVPNINKERVWMHCAVHPAENTAYFMGEGLIDWLLSGDPEAEIVLDNLIINIVLMANPDGVYLGNYRTTSQSVDMERQYRAPYNSTVPEVVALRTRIEQYMGTSTSPGSNPIKVLLNHHATHGNGPPFHFVHNANYNINGTGVIPEVRALEDAWVSAFRARSPLVNNGSDAFSSLSGRPFVESMMHDRYTLHPSGVWDPVMAITFEGTYERSLTQGVPNTDDDYRTVGMEMGLALADYFGLDLTANVSDFWMIR